MICSAKAQAVKAGNVSKVTIIHRDTDAAGQLADIRTLIAQGVNAIIINPAGPGRPEPGDRRGDRRGHRRHRRRRLGHRAGRLQPVQRPGAVRLPRRQVAVQGSMGGKGAVVYMRGIAGHPADTDRDTGFKKALEENPGITVAEDGGHQVGSGHGHPADQRHHERAARSSTASGRPASTRTSSTRSRPPTIRTCRSSARTTPASSTQLLDERGPRRAPRSPTRRPIGGAGVTLALQILGGKKPASNDRPRHAGAVGATTTTRARPS